MKPYAIGQKLFTSQAGGFADHFHPFMCHCMFACIVVVRICYYGKQTYKVSCVADSKDYMILGRHHALLMVYVSFPEIQQPAVKAKRPIQPLLTILRNPLQNQLFQ